MSAVIEPKGIHHGGFIVSDIDRSIAFYEAMFGAELDWKLDVAGPEAADMQGLDEADFTIAYVRFANDIRIELIQYRAPANGHTEVPPAYNLGAGHMCIWVDDVVESYAALEARGMRFLGAPLHIADGPAAGWVVAYGVDPDGNRLELLQT
jgi:catechol 2,3-dioxygenase-like lactoylglutathione lyase family enzyme